MVVWASFRPQLIHRLRRMRAAFRALLQCLPQDGLTEGTVHALLPAAEPNEVAQRRNMDPEAQPNRAESRKQDMGKGTRLALLLLGLSTGAGMAQASDVRGVDGAVRVAERAPDGSARIEVMSAEGWTCAGRYAAPRESGEMVRFDLNCDDAVEAKAIMSVDPATGRAALVFDRDDGHRGSATFGME